MDEFCQEAIIHAVEHESLFSEAEDVVMCRRHRSDQELIEEVFAGLLRSFVFCLTHHSPLAGHPGQNILHNRTRKKLYYWPPMGGDILETVRDWTTFVKNRTCLIKWTHPLTIFHAEKAV